MESKNAKPNILKKFRSFFISFFLSLIPVVMYLFVVIKYGRVGVGISEIVAVVLEGYLIFLLPALLLGIISDLIFLFLKRKKLMKWGKIIRLITTIGIVIWNLWVLYIVVVIISFGVSGQM